VEKNNYKGYAMMIFHSERTIKVKDKGHVGMYFTLIGGQEFQKVWHLK
jgi:muramidase (phage lysozyme)